MTSRATLVVKSGDDYSKVLTITDAAGDPINLDGSTLTLHSRARGGTTDVITPAPTLTQVAPGSNQATLTLTDTQTAALTPGQYTYEIEVVDSGALVSTPVEGIVRVTADRG